MSHRQEDEPLIPWLRRLQDRVERLEKGDKGVRQNDIRLGDMLITTDATTDEVCIQNLLTGDITCLGRQTVPMAGWSFSGLVELNSDPDLNISPPYVMSENSTAIKIVIASRESFTGTVSVCVNFANGVTTKLITLSSTMNTIDINVPMSTLDTITLTLVGPGTDCKNLSVFVWFGHHPRVDGTYSDC